MLIQFAFSEITGISNGLYENFIIKERFGFNKMTLGTFWSDKFKSVLLTIILGGPIYYGIMKIIVWGGPYFYLYLGGFFIVMMILLVNLIPNFIMPLFNKYTDLADVELKRRIEDLARDMKFPLKEIKVMDASKRTAHSNAFYYGFGSNKRIVLYDTLLKQHKGPKGIEEIVGIVRHELGHWYFMHPLLSMLFSIFNLIAMFTVFSFVINNHLLLYQFGFFYESNFISLVIFGKLYELVSWLTSLLMTLITRKFEFQADEFAARDDSLRMPLCRALIKLHILNAGNLNPDPLYAAIKFSHPQLTERLKALRFDPEDVAAEVEIEEVKEEEEDKPNKESEKYNTEYV